MRNNEAGLWIILFVVLVTARSPAQSFHYTGSLHYGRYSHTATLLPNGSVLVAGGYGNYGNSAEVYKPSTGAWSVTGNMNATRALQTATLLNNGTVLLAGGYNSATAEIYNPSTGTFTYTGSMNAKRQLHTATLLSSGKVLIVGGGPCSGGICTSLASAELYDPATGKFTYTGSLHTGRTEHTATLLSNGKVLISAGLNVTGATSTTLATAELYDPSTGTFGYTGTMERSRQQHTAVKLSDGKVMVCGGHYLSNPVSGSSILSSSEIYDPATGQWTTTGSMNAARMDHSMTLLNNGTVLVAGGLGATAGGGSPLATAELYFPSSGSWSYTASMNATRENHTATLLTNGDVIISAGASANPTIVYLTSAELYY